jgi:hypothetical protein
MPTSLVANLLVVNEFRFMFVNIELRLLYLCAGGLPFADNERLTLEIILLFFFNKLLPSKSRPAELDILLSLLLDISNKLYTKKEKKKKKKKKKKKQKKTRKNNRKGKERREREKEEKKKKKGNKIIIKKKG